MGATVKQRLIEFLKYKNISQRTFAKLVGLSDGYVNAIRESIQPDTVRKIAECYPELSTGWLLTGEGEMLKRQIFDLKEFRAANNLTQGDAAVYFGVTQSFISQVERNVRPVPDEFISKIKAEGKFIIQEGSGTVALAEIKNTSFVLVPLYNFDAVGGMGASNDIIDAPAYIERYIPFAGARKDDICISVTGNSMMPTYSSGSILLVRKVDGWKEYFGYGLCYVLFLKDGRRILKEVQKSEADPQKYVLCVSYNSKNPSEELPRDFIIGVYKVIMVLTNEGF